MKRLALMLVAVLALTGCAPAAPRAPHQGEVGVQLFMWNWNSIAKECTDYLGPAGIDWVETSPPQEHVTGSEWWIHYQAASYKLESRLGTKAEYQNMIDTCKEAGVGIVADALVNHMTGRDSGTGWAGSEFTKYEYPGIYTSSDFHHCDNTSDGQIQDYSDLEQVTNCELVGLADLDTASPKVQKTIVAYLQELLDMGVIGFRFDAAKHIYSGDLKAIIGQLPKDTWILQEVIRGGANEPTKPEYYTSWGDVFEFGITHDYSNMVGSGVMSSLVSETRVEGYVPSASGISFISNHDTERNGSSLSWKKNAKKFEIGTAMMLADPYGKAMLYSGYAFTSFDDGPNTDESGRVLDVQCVDSPSAAIEKYADGDWICQHRWASTAAMIQFRDVVGDAPMTDTKKGSGIVGWGRGDRGYIFVNLSKKPYADKPLKTSMAAGTYCDVFSGGPNALKDGKCAGLEIEVAGDGTISYQAPAGTMFAIHKGSKK
ncbi:MAG: hypothetical protein RL716_409 [Actinomycetota bacterium]|uniref:alpha-amylase n=1 Tax=Rhodoluna sp. TaxID=1969481 RepID=UPI0025EEAF5E|nr:alpha-amylase family protein [Rhodoluna sp.]